MFKISTSSIIGHKNEFDVFVKKVQVATNLEVKDIKQIDKTSLEGKWIFTITYANNMGHIQFKGTYTIIDIEYKVKELLKTKKPHSEVTQEISNRCFVDGVLTSKILKLPPPIPLPSIPIGN